MSCRLKLRMACFGLPEKLFYGDPHPQLLDSCPLSTEMSAGGFEPPTNGLKGHCSAVELRAREARFYHGEKAKASRGLEIKVRTS